MAIYLPEIHKILDRKLDNSRKRIGVDLSLINRDIVINGISFNNLIKKYIQRILIGSHYDNLVLFSLDSLVNVSDFLESLSLTNPNNMTIEVNEYKMDPLRTIGLVVDLDYCVASKLHCGFTRWVYNKPFYHIEYHSKVTNFLDEISYNNEFRNLDDYDLLSHINNPNEIDLIRSDIFNSFNSLLSTSLTALDKLKTTMTK